MLISITMTYVHNGKKRCKTTLMLISPATRGAKHWPPVKGAEAGQGPSAARRPRHHQLASSTTLRLRACMLSVRRLRRMDVPAVSALHTAAARRVRAPAWRAGTSARAGRRHMMGPFFDCLLRQKSSSISPSGKSHDFAFAF